MSETPRFPAYFLSHGAPNLILDKSDPTKNFLAQLGKDIRKIGVPKAILMISAHYEAPTFTVTTSPQPPTIHDFYGFEKEMYQMKYPARSDSLLAQRVCELLQGAGMKCTQDAERGYDHGCWSPLMIMFPEADVPVVQLSLLTSLKFEDHIAAGKALQSLRDEGYLIIGSGGATHNLGALDRGVTSLGANSTAPQEWASDFDQWLKDCLVNKEGEERNEMLRNTKQQKSADKSHPRYEHFMPVTVAAAVGGKGTQIHSDWKFGSLSMAAYAFA